jgi:hypothetical protein
MKKHILLASIVLANLAFMRDIKANGSIIPPNAVTATVSTSSARTADKTIEATNIFSRLISRFQNKKAKPKAPAYEFTAHTLKQLTNFNGGDNTQVGDQLFSNEKISISSIYPNPASSYASIDYNLSNQKDQKDQAKIILCNVLGNVVGEYPLVKDAKRLYISTQELSSGVYFYTLSVEGKSLITKKLIIRHQS